MLKTVIGVVTGCILGIAIGVSFVAPGLDPSSPEGLRQISGNAAVPPVPGEKSGRVLSWSLGSTFPITRPHVGAMIERVGKAVWRVSGGGFELRFSAAVPGKQSRDDDGAEALTAVEKGDVDAVFTTPDAWAKRGPAMALFAGIPFGPKADEFLAWFDKGGGREIYQDLHHQSGTHGILCGVTPGATSGWFRNRIAVPEDLHGMSVRATGLSAAIYAQLQAKPVNLADSAIAAAFETGALDAASLELPSMDSKLTLEQSAKHYYLSGWQPRARFYELAINLTKWEDLSPAHRSRLTTVCGDTIRTSLAETEAMQFDALKDLQSRNVEIYRWPAEVLGAGRAAWEKIVEKQSLTDKSFRQAWESLAAFREDYAIWRELKAGE